MTAAAEQHSTVKVGDYYSEGKISWVVTNITKANRVVLYSCYDYIIGSSAVYNQGIPQVIDIADFIERRYWSTNN